MFDPDFLDDAGSIFSLKRRKKPKTTTTLFPWNKGCLPSLVRFVIQLQPQLGLPGRWCDREVLGTQGRAKQPQDCDVCSELMRGGVLLSIPTRYQWKMPSLGAPGKHQSRTTRKMRCSKIFGRRAQLEQSPEKVKISLLPAKGLPGNSWIQAGMQVGQRPAPHHHPLLPGGQHSLAKADFSPSDGAQHSRSPQSRQQWPCPA